MSREDLLREGQATLRFLPYRIEGACIRIPLCLSGARPLYQAEELVLDTGFEDLSEAEIPSRLVWTLVLYALHTQFLFLGECRVEVPETIADEDRALLYATAEVSARALERQAMNSRSNPLKGRLHPRFEILHPDRDVTPYPPVAVDESQAATCFSGGKESLCQVAMLRTRFDRPWLVWHRHSSMQTPPEAIETIHDHGHVRTVIASSNVREMVNGRVLHQELGFHPNLLIASMCHTIQATLALFGYARRIPLLMQGAERETHSWARHADGGVTFLGPGLQNCVYQRVVQRLLTPAGDFVFSSPLGPLTNYQTQSFLIRRAPDLLQVQESCFSVGPWCSECTKCFRIAAILAAHGIAPSSVGLNTARLLPATAGAIRRQMRAYRTSDQAVLGAEACAAPTIYFALSILKRDPALQYTFLPENLPWSQRATLRLRLLRVLSAIDTGRAPAEDRWDPTLLSLFEHPLRPELEKEFSALWKVEPARDVEFTSLVELDRDLQRVGTDSSQTP